MANVTLPGSERDTPPGAQMLGPADPNERLEVSLIVRRRAADVLRAQVAALGAPRQSPLPPLDAAQRQVSPQRSWMSRAEFGQRHGANPSDLAAVKAFAAAHGLQVVQEAAARRTVVVSGTVAQCNAAFGVQLQRMRHGGRDFRGRAGSIVLPVELAGIIEAVLGLDNRPQAAPHFRFRPSTSAAPTSFTPVQVADLYGFPAATGQGECVALIELGGGFRAADLDTYFNGLGQSPATVVAVSVDGATNSPGDANGPDGEVMLDIEVVGAIAPQAQIAVYFAPNTDAGFLDAVTTAVHDSVRNPSVISISWGGSESTWTTQAKTAMDEAFQAAAAMGITVCVASGDNGSSDGVADGANHVDFPASSPHALACGGTSLKAAGGSIGSEAVWNDGASGGASGGGVSGFFARPAWQADLSVRSANGASTALTQRGVPDVAGDADPETGYIVRVDGAAAVIGGTSAVAPLWAALIARINQLTGHAAGYVNPQLYANPQALRDITSGNNGSFAAAPGWDACTGLGSPNGAALRGVI